MSLAKPGDPLVTPTGQLVVSRRDDPATMQEAITYNRVPQAESHRSTVSRTIKDMPSLVPNRQHAIILVLNYRLFGLTVLEIANTLHITPDEVRELIADEAYQQTFELLFNEIISANSTSMLARINNYSGKALDRIRELSDDADKDIVSLRASQDLLDRAGLNSRVLHEQGNAAPDSLKIVIQSGNDKQTNVNININPRGK